MGVISSYRYTLLVDNHLVLLPPNHFLPLIGRLTPEKNMITTISRICVFYSHDSTGEEEIISLIIQVSERNARGKLSRILENTRNFYNRPYCIKVAWGYPVEFEPARNADPRELIRIMIIMLTNFLF